MKDDEVETEDDGVEDDTAEEYYVKTNTALAEQIIVSF